MSISPPVKVVVHYENGKVEEHLCESEKEAFCFLAEREAIINGSQSELVKLLAGAASYLHAFYNSPEGGVPH